MGCPQEIGMQSIGMYLEVMRMAVVVEKKIRNTVVRIHDDYCRSTTPEQVQEILKRIALRAKAEFGTAAENDEELKKAASV